MNLKSKRLAAITAGAIFLGGIGVASATSTFTDVDSDRFYAAAVDWAEQNEITEGTSPGNFSPDRAMTRAEGVTMLHRYNESFSGGMYLAPIQAAMDVGTVEILAELDGVRLNMQCYTGVWVDPATGETDPDYPSAVDVGLYVWFSSTADGWYGNDAYSEDDSYVLSADDVFDLFDESTGDGDGDGEEYASYEYDSGAVATPNGGYMAVDGETHLGIMKPSVRDNDCEFYAMLQWAPPAN